MLRKILLSTAILACASAPAFAAPVYNWTGFYAGVNGGYGGNKFQYPVSGDFTPGGEGATTTSLDGSANLTSSGFLGGAQLGYNYLYPNGWLLGAEADIDAASIKGEISAGGGIAGQLTGSASLHAGSKIDYLGTVRARVGYVSQNDFLIYGTAGWAYGGVKSSFGVDAGSGSSTLFTATNSKSTGRSGWALGAGAEYPVSDRVTFKAEYLYADLGKHTIISTPFSALGGTGDINLGVKTTAHIVRVGLNYALD